MTLPVHPDSTVLAAMASLADCGRAEGFACVSARTAHGAMSVDLLRPQLALVLQGDKHIRHLDQPLHVRGGELFLVSRACRIDVVNTPDPDSGRYLTAIIPLSDEVLTAARSFWSGPLPEAGPTLQVLALPRFSDALLRWRQALQDGEPQRVRLALLEIVLQLCHDGHGALLLPPVPNTSAQVRTLIDAQPERDWQSRDFEEALGMSGATLRRRLAAEGCPLRTLLADARLAHAMALLYTTTLPLKSVAARVGYRSVGSFSRRFQQRYAMDPAAIGNT